MRANVPKEAEYRRAWSDWIRSLEIAAKNRRTKAGREAARTLRALADEKLRPLDTSVRAHKQEFPDGITHTALL